MKKKLIISTILLTIISLLTFSYTFAANNGMENAANDVRNFVGGAENAIEDAGKDAANGIRSGINAIGDGAKNLTNDTQNGMSGMDEGTGTTGTGDYTATRTGSDTDGAGLLTGVSNNVWTWLVIAIVGIVIVALVMFYAKQNTNVTTYYNDDDDDDRE